MEDDQIKEMETTEACREATHHSKLDPRSLKVRQILTNYHGLNII